MAAIEAPAGSAPARALVSGAARGRVYLAGRPGLYRSDDWGQSWVDVGSEFQAERASALVVPSGRPDQVYAVAGGRLWVAPTPRAAGSRGVAGFPSGAHGDRGGLIPRTRTVSGRWAPGQVFRREDQGQRWQPVGQPLPEQPVVARAVAVSGRVILVATDRGVYRGPDDGERWEVPSEGLPAHLEAGLLVLDPGSPATLYAGFALMRYEELSRRAEGGRPFGRLALTSLAGGVAFLALLVLGAGVVVQRLARTYYRTPFDRSGASTVSRTRRSGHVAR